MDQLQKVLSPDILPRLAAIDIGSNSLRMVVAESQLNGEYRILDEEKEPVRLAEELSRTGCLADEAMARALATLGRMKQILTGFQVQRVRVIATCAVREASNGAEFCARVRAETGFDVEVISAEQEAHLAFLSVQKGFSLVGKIVALADIGGGSTELVLAAGDMVEAVYGTPLGAVRLTEQFGAEPDEIQTESLFAAIDEVLEQTVHEPLLTPHLLIGSGGTFTALAEMVMFSKSQSRLPVRGYEITHAEVRHLLDRLRKLPLRARRTYPGLSPDRADIIVAGLAVIDRLLRFFHVNRLQVHDRGVRDGLLLSMLAELHGAATAPPVAEAPTVAAEKFAASCGVHLPHSRQVARLAASLCRQLGPHFELTEEDAQLVELAALLQDVGYLINYEQHHKHSYHLILNSRLPGLTPAQLELVALVARYHRGSPPKKKHPQFAELPRADRRRVKRLAAILRLAGGCDRSHTQQVRELFASIDGRRICVQLQAESCPEVDLWGARKRIEPFERAFKVHVTIEWARQATACTSGEGSLPSLDAASAG